jgi:signal transduction histidine kinase
VHISDAVELAAYRILQESLTNWRRHASGAPVQVTISYDRDRLRVEIENEMVDSANGNDVRQGAGIAGMRERATSLGGTVQAARADGCFRVAAELPYSPAG